MKLLIFFIDEYDQHYKEFKNVFEYNLHHDFLEVIYYNSEGKIFRKFIRNKVIDEFTITEMY